MLANKGLSASDLICVLCVLGTLGQGLSQDTYDGDSATWGLVDSSRTKTCVMLSGFFEVTVPYMTIFGTHAIASLTVPKNASVAGSCEVGGDTNAQEITLMWSPKNHPELGLKHNLTFLFIRRGMVDDQAYVLEPYYELYTLEALIWVNPYDFPNSIDEEGTEYVMTASNLGLMSAPVSLSYACKASQIIEFDDGRNSMTVAYARAEAFHTELALGDERDFGPKSFCAKDGFEVILMVITYVTILALIGLAIFYIVDRRSKGSYIYL